MKPQTDRRLQKKLNILEQFYASWRFPVFTLSILISLMIFVVVIAFIPVSESAVGSFAEEFKKWCLGYDPATGQMEPIYLLMFIVQPLILCVFIIGFWFSPLKTMLNKKPKKAIPYLIPGLVIVALMVLTLPTFFAGSEDGELPFPAESLRTDLTPPDFTLVNQDKATIRLADFRGKVVMITAVYASCNETCPIILEQAKSVIQQLSDKERKDLHLMALTMDPEKDTPKMLKMTADHYELTGPNQHLLTGEKEYINEKLDMLNIPRQRRADGAIDHANVFVLVDKAGSIAYRFTIGERQERWLLKATRLLLDESHPNQITETR